MIIREPGRNRWVVIDQDVIRNPKLSHRARGILCLLLSMPDDWHVNADWIAMHGSEGRDAVRAALTELENAGHIVRHKSQDAFGRWSTRSVVYEQPVDRGVEKSATEDGFPGVGFPGPIRSTKEEVLTPRTTDMVQEREPKLCTRCRGEGRIVGPIKPYVPMYCPKCGGDGLGTDG